MDYKEYKMTDIIGEIAQLSFLEFYEVVSEEVWDMCRAENKCNVDCSMIRKCVKTSVIYFFWERLASLN